LAYFDAIYVNDVTGEYQKGHKILSISYIF